MASQSASQAISQLVSQPVSQPFGKSVSQSDCHSVSQSVSQTVRPSVSQSNWHYYSVICLFKGKCSVIKALDLRAQLKLPRPRRATNEEYFPMGLIGRKRRTQSDTSKIWLRELEESLKTPYSFNDSNKVDEHRDENER